MIELLALAESEKLAADERKNHGRREKLYAVAVAAFAATSAV